MGELWRAGTERLRKNRVLLAGMLAMAALGIYAPVELYLYATRMGGVSFLDEVFLNGGVFHIVLSAAVCSLFLGTEYSDGTLRRKVIVGHTRAEIYLSNLASCTLANLLLCGAYLVPALVLGLPLLGFSAGVGQVILYLTCQAVMALAVAALYTLISMTSQNRALSAVVCLLLAVAMLLAASYLNGTLGAPAETIVYEVVGDNQLVGELVPNPAYVQGSRRAVYELIYDLLPTGQAMQLSGLAAERLWRLPLFSGLIALIATALGMAAFQGRDLK